MTKSVFYSFDFSNDVHRVQLVRNIGALKGQVLLEGQKWEAVRQRGPKAIEAWIDEQMDGKEAVIVLIGTSTASRDWVTYEIEKAWNERIPILGVKIHGLSSLGSTSRAGATPFTNTAIPVFDPTARDSSGRIDSRATYANLTRDLPSWAGRGAVSSR
ncbi:MULTISPECIES: TIR domain-containing protein [unclassified Aeromicrobium]|uniref:TIR domain-containing protein n=1 Tax=unclassified Aeromicrobium TaxID=2633570 RepID=UPI00288C3929|nr:MULTISPECIES: TIR domain-containing protein [unclassified Aeromicrobium]